MSGMKSETKCAPFFSVVCIYNKPSVLKRDLLASLEKQNFADYELVTIDTKAEGFDRASAALNEACRRAQGQYLVIAHQDMILKKEETLKWLQEECQEAFVKQNYGLLGAAGGKECQEVYSAMDEEAKEP